VSEYIFPVPMNSHVILSMFNNVFNHLSLCVSHFRLQHSGPVMLTTLDLFHRNIVGPHLVIAFGIAKNNVQVKVFDPAYGKVHSWYPWDLARLLRRGNEPRNPRGEDSKKPRPGPSFFKFGVAFFPSGEKIRPPPCVCMCGACVRMCVV